MPDTDATEDLLRQVQLPWAERTRTAEDLMLEAATALCSAREEVAQRDQRIRALEDGCVQGNRQLAAAREEIARLELAHSEACEAGALNYSLFLAAEAEAASLRAEVARLEDQRRWVVSEKLRHSAEAASLRETLSRIARMVDPEKIAELAARALSDRAGRADEPAALSPPNREES